MGPLGKARPSGETLVSPLTLSSDFVRMNLSEVVLILIKFFAASEVPASGAVVVLAVAAQLRFLADESAKGNSALYALVSQHQRKALNSI